MARLSLRFLQRSSDRLGDLMAHADFDLKALYEALDEQRRSRDMSWAAAAREINRFKTGGHPIASSTMTGLRNKRVAEGDGVLQMLLWLHRTPESFVAGIPDAGGERYRLRDVGLDKILRWDTPALHAALNRQRQARGMTWQEAGREVGGFTAAMLTNLAKGGRIGFPGVMRIVRWLGQPATIFTRAANAWWDASSSAR